MRGRLLGRASKTKLKQAHPRRRPRAHATNTHRRALALVRRRTYHHASRTPMSAPPPSPMIIMDEDCATACMVGLYLTRKSMEWVAVAK